MPHKCQQLNQDAIIGDGGCQFGSDGFKNMFIMSRNFRLTLIAVIQKARAIPLLDRLDGGFIAINK